MTGKIIAQKVSPKRSARIIQKKDGTAVYWVFLNGRRNVLAPIAKDKIEETIRDMGLIRLP